MTSLPRHDPLVGSLLDGRYRVVNFLARGGMGQVYVAEEVRLRRRCALKVLHPHQSHDPLQVERFLREAQTMAQFKHPNIIDIFAFGEEPSGMVFFVMELLAGEDLDARIEARAERPFAVRDCCLWAIQAARAVAVVHAAGLIHRDLKASNIFLERRDDGAEVIKLLDFGIARREEGSELTGTGISLGTPSYMAPEQFKEGVEIDRRVDIYAFGVVLYRLLTGQPPFTGDMFQLAVKHNKRMRPPPPSRVAPEAGISARLEAVVLKCLAKQPGDRYASMQQVEDALAVVLREDASRPGFAVVRAPTREPQAASASASAMQREPGTPPARASQTGPTVASAIASRVGRRFHLTLAAGMFGVLMLLATALMRRGAESSAEDALSISAGSEVDTWVPAKDQEAEDMGLVRAVPFAPPNRATPALTPVAVTPTMGRPAAQPVDISKRERAFAPPARKQAEAVKPDASKNPRTQVQAKASACRRKFKAVDGPKILVSYWVGNDGKAHEARAAADDELGACLAAAVMATQFELRLELSKEISL